ncbi:MAG: pyruvate:ferredoxin (flavodoxin) oxidoreductase [Acidobacteriota bacterium]
MKGREETTSEAVDGNEAAARVAYSLSEVIAIYPITPSSPMGELADMWSATGRANLWGTVPTVVEMQSEGGAAGALHGALTTGSLATTFTSSQGLLLMIPNMFKIAGELTPTVIHVAARSVACHALSIFGDHSDVMATRGTGFALLASGSVQEAADLACIAHASTLAARVPFLHFFDGFRTSHEIQKIATLGDPDLRAMIDDSWLREHRARGLSPERPSIRGTAQNPDVFFQAREAVNPFYLACPGIVQATMDRFAGLTGRAYHLFDYVGHPRAERVVVLMGSGVGAAEEAVEARAGRGEPVGLLKVRLYRPFSADAFVAALPPSVRSIAVLDRTKEPGSPGEPLYLDVVAAIEETAAAGSARFERRPRVIGGRYGLSSKEFTPAMVARILAELEADSPKNHFTIGIVDDVTGTSLDWDRRDGAEPPGTVRAVFYGLGADGTVGANKNSIKIIAEQTGNQAQGYFVYDSKKAGSVTVSHLRFGPRPIRSTYLIRSADFVACHQESFLETMDILEVAGQGATFLLNCRTPPDRVWDRLPRDLQETIIAKRLRLFVIDAYRVAREAGLGRRINTVMQTCFFAISGVLPIDRAVSAIKESIRRTYARKSEQVVAMNIAAVDAALSAFSEVRVPQRATSTRARRPVVPDSAPDFVRRTTAEILAGRGDLLPVSALPVDGTFPTGTARWEKRNIALTVPAWDEQWCIQCNKCAMVCPHAAIRVKAYPAAAGAGAPATFKSMEWRGTEFPRGTKYTVQVAVEDCTGCGMCVEICPAKNKTETRFKAINMVPQAGLREPERDNLEFFLGLPEADRTAIRVDTVKGSQLLEPLFEYSGACAGCGETPYLKLMTQLFGDRLLVANATGCSSIYGGNLPTTPWSSDRQGRGPAWSNSLFEDNAEFGLGFRLSLDKRAARARELLQRLRPRLGDELVRDLLESRSRTESELARQRARLAEVRRRLAGHEDPEARDLLSVADALVRSSVWIVGGDGWAYDIGFGGLDHVLNSGHDVNVLVLDTEVYSNTGGQASKATPRAASAKFASAGKAGPRKDLVGLALTYGHVYVARVAMGASDAQTVKAFLEAEAYPGPSLIVAYSHCIAHGINMTLGMTQQKLAVDSGYWPLLRYHPDEADGGTGLHLDSKPPRIKLEEYAYRETRYRILTVSHPERARRLMELARRDVQRQWRLLTGMAAPRAAGSSGGGSSSHGP